MFDMLDVIHMSRISKHYLLEYQTLLETYEMQASNITSGFRVIDFPGDISDEWSSSDEWSVNEPYSETSAQMTNSSQAHILSNPPEYSVSAGSKPLSLIIRRCNTPTVVCPSPVLKADKENDCKKGCEMPNGQSGVLSVFTCQNLNVDEHRKSSKIVQLNSLELEKKSLLNMTQNEKALPEANEEMSNCVSSVALDGNSDDTTILKEDNSSFSPSNVNDQSSMLTDFSNFNESKNVDISFECIEGNGLNTVLNNSPQTIPNSSCISNNCNKNGECTEQTEHSTFDMKISNSLNMSVVDVPKEQASILNEIPLCDNKINSFCNTVKFHTIDIDANVTDQTSQYSAGVKLSNSFCNISNLSEDKSNFENSMVETSSLFLAEDLDTISFECVEGWRQLSCSPVLFSSDDENSSITEEVNKGIEAALAPSPQYNVVLSCEKKKVCKLQELLMGAPPPPTVTMPLCSATEMLDILRNVHWPVSDSKKAHCCSVIVQEVTTTVWPRAKCLQYPGIYYNHGAVSEQFESLCQKLQARYVASETASSVTAWSYFTHPAPRRERKLLPSRHSSTCAPTGLSPGRRLSHLARRHRTFSSTSLLSDGSRLVTSLPHAAPERRTILVETGRKKARSSQKKKKVHLDSTRDAQGAKFNSSKRALFQSPSEEEHKPSVSSKCRPSSASAVRSRRALFLNETKITDKESTSLTVGNSPTMSRKRPRSESEDEVSQQFPRRRLFCDVDTKLPPAPSEGNVQAPELSSTHKKKLLWAVAEALKKQGIGITHPQFRACAATLASTCRVYVQQVLASRRGSTSDQLLQLALRFVHEAVAQHVKEYPRTTSANEMG